MIKKYGNPLVIFREGGILPICKYYTHRHESVLWIHLAREFFQSPRFWDLFFFISLHLGDDYSKGLAKDPPPWNESEMEWKLTEHVVYIHLPESCTLVFEGVNLLDSGPATLFLDWLRGHPVPNLEIIFLTHDSAEVWEENGRR